MVDALYVDCSEHGVYPALLGPEHCWGEERDARTYRGSQPVIAHPPCNRWVNLCAANYARGLREGKPRPEPAWHPYKGSDGGCFAAALATVRRNGGVLEHPANSWAFAEHYLTRPTGNGWTRVQGGNHVYWVCCVWQSAYGHPCAKPTWLVYVGAQPPFELNWARNPGTHQCGWFDRKKPTVSKRVASATPYAFAQTLRNLALHSAGLPLC